MANVEVTVHEVRPAPPAMCAGCKIPEFTDDGFEQEQFQKGVVHIRTSSKEKQDAYLDETTGAATFAAEYHPGMFKKDEAEIIIDCWKNENCRNLHRRF